MQVVLNGKETELKSSVSLQELLEGMKINPHVVACELNLKIVKRKDYQTTAISEGDHVVMVEDVITTGGSVLTAIQEVEKLKAKVVRVICLVDRNEGAAQILANYNYTPIFSLRDLGL